MRGRGFLFGVELVKEKNKKVPAKDLAEEVFYRCLNKGLSFNFKGKLNMKMGLNEFSAHEAINQLDQKDLESIFKYFVFVQRFKMYTCMNLLIRKIIN